MTFSLMTPAKWLLILLVSVTVTGVAAEEDKLNVCYVSGSALYGSEVSLPPFKEWFESQYQSEGTIAQAEGKERLPGLEALETCDVALVFTRRLEITGSELGAIKKYCQGGKPIVAVRTTSHGFQNWLELDQEILGGSYHGHYKADVITKVVPAPGMEAHPILHKVGGLDSLASLYRTHPIAKDATMLLGGVAPQGAQPLAWTREVNGGRVFYTSLGSVEDFQNPAFRRMIANALFWAAGREPAEIPKADE